MQGTRSQSIEVWKVFASNRTKPVQIKMSVSNLKRIKGPNDQPNSPFKSLFPLKKFQRTPNATVAILAKYARHVRMQKQSPMSKSDERQGVADQTLPIKGTQNLPARFLRHHKQCRGLDFQVVFPPNFPLQRDATLKFFHPSAFSDDD